MEKFFGIVLVIIFLLIVGWPLLQKWVGPSLNRWIMGKMEDRMRRMFGMPTRKEEKKARKRDARRRKGGAERFRKAAAESRHKSGRASDLLQSYAEDVEFVEVKSYSQSVEIAEDKDTGETIIKVEEQVEDAIYEEIRTKS